MERLEAIMPIIDIFEDFLEEKGIDIPNEEKAESEGPCIIYGTDCGNLMDRIEAVLTSYGVIDKED